MDETEQLDAEGPDDQLGEAELVSTLSAQCRPWLRSGVPTDKVHTALLRAGLHEDDARALLQDVMATVRHERRERGFRNLLYGGLWLAGSGCGMAAIQQAGQPLESLLLTGLVGLFGAVVLIRGIMHIKATADPNRDAEPAE